LFTAKGYSALERRHFWAILVLFIASALFWSAFEQAGSTLSLFADRNTNLHSWDVSGLWGRFHASYFQAFNSFFVIALAPLFALLWVRLGRREPSSTAKFSWGLLFVALGFAILIPVAHGKNVSPMWLTLTYLLHTVGELCLSPVGLSTMTKLAPARIAGLIMGVWFLSVSVGDYIGGRLSGLYESLPLPELFGVVVLFCVLISASLVFLRRPMRGLMGGVN
jgi:POT family proton-dependent oligopeptide transporter